MSEQQQTSIPSLTPTPSAFAASTNFSLFATPPAQQMGFRPRSSHGDSAPSPSPLSQQQQQQHAVAAGGGVRHRELWSEERHASTGTPNKEYHKPAAPWKMRDRMRTVSAALVLALNIGVDPPDVLKPRPCARLESWVDPAKQAPQKSLELVGKSLQSQYERWQSKAKYKQCLDPTLDDVRRLLTAQRKAAKDDRVLLHYNGHGVPRPSVNGEIWVFNKNYTQYIPLSIYELQSWIGSPTICVFDCNSAGLVLEWYARFAEQRYREQKDPAGQEYILLGACGEGETLPLNPDYPADIFTACLTTPIRMALLWFCNHSRLHRAPQEVAETLPGSPNNRKTPLGELNWIFTTITDTIAWNVLPREVFQRLFRQDLLVATLFRNFLLAERIMRSLGCLPVSTPKLPPTFKHPLWEAWDLAVDMCLCQLPRLLPDGSNYQPSSFFAEQLTAFEVWLEFGSEEKSPPEQLPIVLQVLLSQTHRLRALVLLSRFLDLGSWAVVQALSVGVFPYVLKLLAGQAPELREVLVFIWTKILAIDRQCQADLLKDNGQNYFIGILSSTSLPSSELRVMAAFVLTVIMDGCRQGQEACLSVNLLPLCLRLLGDQDPMMRRWAVLCIAKLWEGMDEAKWVGSNAGAPDRLYSLLEDPSPEVRAAAVYALGTFVSSTPRAATPSPNDTRANQDLNTGLRVFVATTDASPLVRREAVITMSHIVASHWQNFAATVREAASEEHQQQQQQQQSQSQSQQQTRSTSAAPVLVSPHTPQPHATSSPSQARSTPRQRAGMVAPPPPSPSVTTQAQAAVASLPPADMSLASPGGSIYGFLWKAVTEMANDPSLEVCAMVEKLQRAVNKRLARLDQQEESGGGGGALSSSASMWSPAKLSASSTGIRPRAQQLAQPASLVGFDGGPASAATAAAAAGSEPIALRSDFYDWSCEHWHHPLLSRDTEDRTSPEYKAREQRQRANLALFNEARDSWAAWAQNPKRKLSVEVAMLTDNDSVATAMIFHPYRKILTVADERDGIGVWDWMEAKKLVRFSNRSSSPHATRITSLLYANEHDNTQLVVGTNDGVVRVWRDFTTSSPRLSTAWSAMPQIAAMPKQGSGMLLEWLDTGFLLSCGDANLVRLWDVVSEMAVQDIPTGSSHSVTAVASDKSDAGNGRLFVVGCGDGSLRVFDTRVSPRAACVATLQEHRSFVLGVGMPSPSRIVSASAASDIKVWDMSMQRSSLSFAHEDLSAFAVHNRASLMASGSASQRIRVCTLGGEECNIIRYHEGFLGQRMAPVTALAMHPHRLLLAGAFTNSWISVYSTNPLR